MATKTRKTLGAPKPEPVATAVAPDGSVDPTLLTAQVTINGTVYTLCFDLISLARAEHEIRAEGYDVNLLAALPSLNLESTLALFAASIRRFHPGIPYEKALRIPTLASVAEVGLAVASAWSSSLVTEEAKGEKNPTQPGS